VVAEHGVELNIRGQQIGEWCLEPLREPSPDAVAVDVVAKHQHEVELRPVSAIDPHFACHGDQPSRDFAAVANHAEDDGVLRARRR